MKKKTVKAPLPQEKSEDSHFSSGEGKSRAQGENCGKRGKPFPMTAVGRRGKLFLTRANFFGRKISRTFPFRMREKFPPASPAPCTI
jgi:hypothetical protein